MGDYTTLKIKEVVRETADAVTIKFKQPLFKKIKYQPGQFITVILPINGEKVRRSYSMSSTPNLDSHVAVTVKRVEGGLVSNYLNDKVKKGDSIEIMKPMGNFTLSKASGARDVVLFGGGSGITPLMSIARQLLFFEAESKVSLVYANRDEDSIIFKAQLEELQQKFGDRLQVVHILENPKQMWDGYKGRPDIATFSNILNLLSTSERTEYFICGPQGMMDVVKETLQKAKIKDSQINIESFVSTAGPADTSEFTARTVTVRINGNEHQFNVPAEKTILDAGLDEGIDLPFSCQSGLCTACMGKCVSGEVKMTSNDALSNDEINEGYRLLCVGHPESDDVVVEID